MKMLELKFFSTGLTSGSQVNITGVHSEIASSKCCVTKGQQRNDRPHFAVDVECIVAENMAGYVAISY